MGPAPFLTARESQEMLGQSQEMLGQSQGMFCFSFAKKLNGILECLI